MTPPKKAKTTRVGRLVFTIQWDKKGHWIRNGTDHRFHCWLHLGPCHHPKGLICHNLILGPIGIAAVWEAKPNPDDNPTNPESAAADQDGFEEIPDEFKP